MAASLLLICFLNFKYWLWPCFVWLFWIPTDTRWKWWLMDTLIQFSHITLFGFVNEQPNLHIIIHVQSLSAPLLAFSPLLYPYLLFLVLINRFDLTVLTFRTAIIQIGNRYLHTQGLKVMIILCTSRTTRCFSHYIYAITSFLRTSNWTLIWDVVTSQRPSHCYSLACSIANLSGVSTRSWGFIFI